MRAVATQILPGQSRVVLEGTAENASLEGVRLRLPAALTQGSQVEISLEGGPGKTGTVRWVRPSADGQFLHGVNYSVPIHRRASHARPFRRLRFRRRLRRALMALGILAGMVLAVSAVVSVM